MKNLAPIGISTYSRINHLKQTIEALKKNTLARESELYIFSDAAKPGDEDKILQVRKYIHTIEGFKSINIIERETNCYVTNTSEGVKKLLSEYGRCIIMEEDIVTAPGFLRFMNMALDVFEKDDKIFSISGYCPPIDIPDEYHYDIYFLRRACAWGYGIWQDRFKKISYLDNNEVLNRFSNNREVEELSKYGEDLLNMILLDAAGKRDAFDVKVFYYQFLNEKYTVYPVKSLARNIGHDGSGIHCGKTNKFDVDLWDKLEFEIDDNVKLDDRIVKSNYRFRQIKRVHSGIENSNSSMRENISETNKLGENLLFLISQPRASSTLLQRLLGGHPEIHATAEPWIMLHPIYALKENGIETEYRADLALHGLKDFLMQVPEGIELYKIALRKFGSTLYNRMLELSGKRFFLDKTPRYYHIIPELHSIFPEAKFIILLRNPIAVLSSVLKSWFGNRTGDIKIQNHIDLVKGPVCLLNGIEKLKEKAIVVHYESLVKFPDTVMHNLCNSIGIPYYEDMLDYGKNPKPKGRFGDSVGIYQHTNG